MQSIRRGKSIEELVPIGIKRYIQNLLNMSPSKLDNALKDYRITDAALINKIKENIDDIDKAVNLIIDNLNK